MHQGSPVRVRTFRGNGLSLSLSLSLSLFRFGLQSHISSLRLSSGHSSLLLSLRTNDAAHASLPSPHSLVVNTSLCAISLFPLVIAVRGVFCFCFCFFFLLVMLPSDFKTPHRDTCERIFYCVETASLSGCLVSSASIQKLFCGSYSTFK